ncbi:dst1 [Symbiodinium sp. CCMP2592]|nr:dst1 [Symbiodinium sp. CCMP2592]
MMRDALAISGKLLRRSVNDLSETLGAGSFGTVFKGLDTVTKRPVAVKVMEEDDAAAVQAAMEELALLQELRHPAIVQALAVDKTSGQLQMVFAFLGGGSLADTLQRRGVLELDMLRKVCRMRLPTCTGSASPTGISSPTT